MIELIAFSARFLVARVASIAMRTYVVDGDPSVLHQFAEEEEAKSDVLGSRTVGGVTGDV